MEGRKQRGGWKEAKREKGEGRRERWESGEETHVAREA